MINSPRRKARIKADALNEIRPIKMNPLLLISSPIFISSRDRTKQIVLSKAIVMLVFFIVFFVID